MKKEGIARTKKQKRKEKIRKGGKTEGIEERNQKKNREAKENRGEQRRERRETEAKHTRKREDTGTMGMKQRR